LTSGVTVRIALGRVMLNTQLSQSSASMPDSAAAPLVNRVLAAIVDGTPLWRSVGLRTPTAASLPETHADPRQRFVLADSIPELARAAWSTRATLISASDWEQRDAKTAGVLYTIAPIRVWGRFARLNVELSERVARKSDEAVDAYAEGKTYDLMLLNGEWVIIIESGWIT